MGYPTALTAEQWGFEDVRFGGRSVTLARPLGTYVMDNVLFKVAYPAEFHAQTAAEAAVLLHREVVERFDEIERIEVWTQESAIRIIDKRGPLTNPADRDHSLQYVIAVGLLYGTITDRHYEDEIATISIRRSGRSRTPSGSCTPTAPPQTASRWRFRSGIRGAGLRRSRCCARSLSRTWAPCGMDGPRSSRRCSSTSPGCRSCGPPSWRGA
jgi:hypothetical protein